MSAADLIRRNDEILERHECWWREPAAEQEMKELWGDAINDSGVFRYEVEEVLYEKDGCKAEISIASTQGVYAFGCGFTTPTQGSGFAPSVTGELFTSHNAARTTAIEHLLKQFPQGFYQHEEGSRVRVEQMRQHIEGLLSQPSLF